MSEICMLIPELFRLPAILPNVRIAGNLLRRSKYSLRTYDS